MSQIAARWVATIVPGVIELPRPRGGRHRFGRKLAPKAIDGVAAPHQSIMSMMSGISPGLGFLNGASFGNGTSQSNQYQAEPWSLK